MKNNFKDYGFEADFEGEILKEVGNYYIGYIKNINGYIYSTKWDKKGYGWNTDNTIYDLSPTKKEEVLSLLVEDN